MNRDTVAELVMSARTLEECRIAKDVLGEWLQRHPDDVAMHEVGEGLAMLQEALTPVSEATKPSGGAKHLLHPDHNRPYRISFQDEVRLVQAELGWNEETARAFVAEY